MGFNRLGRFIPFTHTSKRVRLQDPANSKTITLVLALGALGIALGGVGIGLATDPSWDRLFDHLHWTVSATAAAAMVWLRYRRSSAADAQRLFWGMLGLMAYATGEVLWGIQSLLGFSAVPAPSDLFYLMLGPLVTVGLLLEVRHRSSDSDSGSAALDALLLTVAMLSLILVLYLPKRGDTGLLPLLVLVAYPATLFAAVCTAVITVLTLRLRLRLGGTLFLLGLTGTAMSWMYWNYKALDGIAMDGTWSNVAFSVSTLLTGVGLSRWNMSRAESLEFDRFCAGVLRLLPIVAVVLAAMALMFSETRVGLPGIVRAWAQAGSVLVILLAMVRQAALLRDRDQLLATRQALQTSQVQLMRERGLLGSLIGNIPDLVWLKDQHGVFLKANPEFMKMYNFTEASLLGKSDFELMGAAKAQVFHDQDRQAIAANAAVRFEEWLLAADGQTRFFETIKTPVRDEAGELIGVLGVSRDITERQRAEQQLRIAAIAFQSQEAIAVTDSRCVILDINRSFTSMTGYTAEEAIGQTPRLLASGRHDAAFYAAMWHTVTTQGSWDGEVWNRRKNGDIYPVHLTITAVRNAHGEVTHYVGASTDITLSKLAEDEIKNLAFYDTLTQLPNRRLLLDRLGHALSASQRNGQSGAVLFLDLDSFKSLNDTLGHDVGDLLLQQVALRLQACVRESDTVARLGGDEFVVLLEGLSGPEIDLAAQVEATANKMLQMLSAPYQLGTRSCHSSSSIGITLFGRTQAGAGVEDLLKQADIAMYQAKSAGRNTQRFFDQHMQEVISVRVALLNDLRSAIDQRQLELFYQVQVDQHGHALGAEALLRWHHPQRGRVPPAEFIALAEESGLILPLGQWVLDAGCAQLAAWQAQANMRELSLSLNISAKQFRQKGFADQVMSAVKRHGAPAHQLILGLTESLLLTDLSDTVVTMSTLRGVGIRFELDDFGTGYSSLQYLKKLPLHKLKIDQSFVDDICTDASDQAIVSTILAVADSLALGVIAEGVETPAQRQVLLAKGCTQFQGNLFGQPMPAAELEALLMHTQAAVGVPDA